MNQNPIYANTLRDLASPGHLRWDYRKVYLCLRFPEYDKDIPNCHLTLKYFNRVKGTDLLSHGIALEEFLPVALNTRRWDHWDNGGNFYEGIVFDKDESPGLFHSVGMPHVTIPPSMQAKKPKELEFYLKDAEFIADRVYVGYKDRDKTRFDTLMEFFTNA